MAKTRIAPRHPCSKAARIEFVGSRAIDCVVRNLSLTGAAILVPSKAGIPRVFVLTIPEDRLRLACHVVWQNEFRIGVAFD
jgi:hypothetical protein